MYAHIHYTYPSDLIAGAEQIAVSLGIGVQLIFLIPHASSPLSVCYIGINRVPP